MDDRLNPGRSLLGAHLQSLHDCVDGAGESGLRVERRHRRVLSKPSRRPHERESGKGAAARLAHHKPRAKHDAGGSLPARHQVDEGGQRPAAATSAGTR